SFCLFVAGCAPSQPTPERTTRSQQALTQVDIIPVIPGQEESFGTSTNPAIGQTLSFVGPDLVLHSLSFYLGLDQAASLSFRASVSAWDGTQPVQPALFISN